MKNSSLISSEKLQVEFSQLDFVLKTQQQIAKDFASCGVRFPLDFLEKTFSTNEILEQVQMALKNVSSMEQLLYRIDVPEELFEHSVDFELLSEIVLRREAYKVWLRSQF